FFKLYHLRRSRRCPPRSERMRSGLETQRSRRNPAECVKTIVNKTAIYRPTLACRSLPASCSIKRFGHSSFRAQGDVIMATDTLATPADLSSTQTRVFKNFIDGEWVESSTGETFENRNPADTRDLVGIFQKSNKADVNAAVDAAKRAFAKWRLVPPPTTPSAPSPNGAWFRRHAERRSCSVPPRFLSSARKITPAT